MMLISEHEVISCKLRLHGQRVGSFVQSTEALFPEIRYRLTALNGVLLIKCDQGNCVNVWELAIHISALLHHPF